MAIESKYRVKEVAADFGVSPKEISDIVGQYYEKPRSLTQVLTTDELNAVFEHMTRNNQISDLTQVFNVKPKEAPKAEAPKAEAAPQQQARPQQGQNQNRPQQQAGRPMQQGQGNRPQQERNTWNICIRDLRVSGCWTKLTVEGSGFLGSVGLF